MYHTARQATVIVQATGSKLSDDQCIDALREALKQANKYWSLIFDKGHE